MKAEATWEQYSATRDSAIFSRVVKAWPKAGSVNGINNASTVRFRIQISDIILYDTRPTTLTNLRHQNKESRLIATESTREFHVLRSIGSIPEGYRLRVRRYPVPGFEIAVFVQVEAEELAVTDRQCLLVTA